MFPFYIFHLLENKLFTYPDGKFLFFFGLEKKKREREDWMNKIKKSQDTKKKGTAGTGWPPLLYSFDSRTGQQQHVIKVLYVR